MAEVDKVDVFISAASIVKSGDTTARNTVNKLIIKALEQDKKTNQYSTKIVLKRSDKKLINGYSV